VSGATGGRHNDGVHPTRDTLPVINLHLAGGRVMPGVRQLLLMGDWLDSMIRGRNQMRKLNVIAVGLLCCLMHLDITAQGNQGKPAEFYPSPTRPVNCEDVTAYVETAMVMAQEAGEDSYLIIITRLGDGERSRKLSLDRVHTVKAFMRRWRGKSVVAEGDRVKGYGRLEIYVGGKQVFILPLGRNAQVDFWSCMYA